MTTNAQPESTSEPIVTEQAASSENTNSAQDTSLPESERKTILLVYILQAAGFLIGLSFIAGVIVNYVKRGDLKSPIAQDHCSYQIRTFWWSTLWVVLSILLSFVIIGYLTALVAIFWTLYRVIRGFMCLNDGKPVSAKK